MNDSDPQVTMNKKKAVRLEIDDIEFIAKRLDGLSLVAARNEQPLLAYLLEMALLEARSITDNKKYWLV